MAEAAWSETAESLAAQRLSPSTSPPPSPFKPNLAHKFLYSLGQFAQSGAFDTAIPFVFFYYTAVLGLPGAAVGLALSISLAFDAVVDPVVGAISDNLRSRLGRRVPLMLLGAPLIPLALGLMFAPPHGLSIPALTAWLAVTCVSARMAVSLFNVPYFALGAEMSEDYVERSRVVAWRAIMGIFAGLAVNLAAYGVFFVGKAGLQRASAYPGFGWAAGILVGVMALVCAVGMMRYAARLPQPAPRPGASIARLPLDALEIWRNPSFRCLFASAVIFYVAVGLNGTFGAHTAVFVWRLPTAQIQLLPYSFLAGLLVGATAAPAVSTRLEKKTMVQLGLVTVILIWLVMPILRILHIYMPTGAAATPPLMANMVFVGVGMGLASVAYPSMMADAADEHELREGVRREGLYFAGLAFAGKAAAGLGILMAGFALDIIGFPHVTGGLAPSAISEPTLQRLLLASGPTAALLCAIAMVVFAPYAISRALHAQIAQALTERRQHGRGA